MNFRNYERPDGHFDGAPQILVTQHTAERYGLPEVDYEGLEELVHRDIGIHPDKQQTFKLYTSSRDRGIANASPGFTDPLSFKLPNGDVYINAAIAVNNLISPDDPRGTFIPDRGGSNRRGRGVLEQVIYHSMRQANKAEHPISSRIQSLLMPATLGAVGTSAFGVVNYAEQGAPTIGLIGAGAGTLALYGVGFSVRDYRKIRLADLKAQGIELHYEDHKNNIVMPDGRHSPQD